MPPIHCAWPRLKCFPRPGQPMDAQKTWPRRLRFFNPMRPGFKQASSQQGLGEFASIESLQIFKFFTHADEIDGHGLFAGDGGQHAAFGGAEIGRAHV